MESIKVISREGWTIFKGIPGKPAPDPMSKRGNVWKVRADGERIEKVFEDHPLLRSDSGEIDLLIPFEELFEIKLERFDRISI